jgi:membrane-associated phospholipid phosphatase
MVRSYGIGWISTTTATLLLLATHRKKSAAIVATSGIFSLSNQIIKWMAGRLRPFNGDWPFQFHPFFGGPMGLFHAEGPLSFPSGDATLAFAMTLSLSWALPRWTLLWWMLGIWIALERIMEGAHYPSDVVAGAGLGILCALLARRMIDSSMDKQPEQLLHGK